jgi:hypothetical protein
MYAERIENGKNGEKAKRESDRERRKTEKKKTKTEIKIQVTDKVVPVFN